jgi:hypothetical protein
MNNFLAPSFAFIKNETRVREAEEFFFYWSAWQRKENCDRKSTGTYIIPPPLFFSFFSVNTTGGTPETTNVFSLWIIENSIVLHYFNTYFITRPIKRMFTEVNFIFVNPK